jgi:hypothetical protein
MGRKYICLALAVFVFTLIADFSYVVSYVYADGPSIGGAQQMPVGGSQTLTATGGCGGYTWSIIGGGGSLSSSTGDSTTYNAPTSNPDCENNPTIRIMDSCGNTKDMQIAVNSWTGNDIAYSTCHVCYTGSCGGYFCTQYYNCTEVEYQGSGYGPGWEGWQNRGQPLIN